MYLLILVFLFVVYVLIRPRLDWSFFSGPVHGIILNLGNLGGFINRLRFI